jgi:hypothetical protein
VVELVKKSTGDRATASCAGTDRIELTCAHSPFKIASRRAASS